MEEQLAMGAKSANANTLPRDAELVAISQRLLDAARNGDSNAFDSAVLGKLEMRVLVEGLGVDAARKAFWINLYNAFNHQWMSQGDVVGLRKRFSHFFVRRISIAGMRLSLNDIEHGILRRSRLWWARGWLRNPLPGRWERLLGVDVLDSRIHFALNCGARSCPAIRYYTLEGIEQELEVATQAFVQSECVLLGQVLEVSELFRMYIGDFGGRRRLVEVLKPYLSELPAGIRLRFRRYDWTTRLDHWAE